jgi:valyl-tRNA synthetase
MPYVTEELWQRLRPYSAGAQPVEAAGAEPVEAQLPDALIVAPFPQANASWRDEEAERQVDQMIDVVRAIRKIRSEKNVEAARTIEAYVVIGNPSTASGSGIEASTALIETLARASLRVVRRVADAPSEGVATAVLENAQVVVPLAGLLDVGAERIRLEKEIAETEQYVSRIDAKLSNEQFRSKAPADVVAAEEERRAKALARLEGLRRALGEVA